MKFIFSLSSVEIITLQNLSKYHPQAQVRTRGSLILLSHEKLPLKDIARISGITRQTASIWIDNWEEKGICGLFNEHNWGKPSKLTQSEKLDIIKLVKKTPRSLKKVLSEIKQRYGIDISQKTLKRICKSRNMSWKRLRKSLKKKRDDEAFYLKLEEIKDWLVLADKGELDFYYFDESGFTLEPCIPYAWQDKNETIELPSSRSKRLNVLGFMSHQCDHFESYIFNSNVNSDVVIACIDDFTKKIKKEKKTILLIDNASTHTSKAFLSNVEKWKEKGLIILNIPPYSPELNKIEILWRKIKYEWLPFSAYDSFKSLSDSLDHILSNIGGDKEYKVNFSPLC
jgi:transposase